MPQCEAFKPAIVENTVLWLLHVVVLIPNKMRNKISAPLPSPACVHSKSMIIVCNTSQESRVIKQF